MPRKQHFPFFCILVNTEITESGNFSKLETSYYFWEKNFGRLKTFHLFFVASFLLGLVPMGGANVEP